MNSLPASDSQTGAQAASSGTTQGTPVYIKVPAGATPQQIYEALRQQQSELSTQVQALEEKRNDLSRQLANRPHTNVDQKWIETRLTDVEQQIAVVDKQLAVARADVAKAAAVPGAVVEKVIAPRGPRLPDPHPNEADYVLTFVFGVIILLPMSIAFARRIWRRSAAAVSNWPKGLNERIDRLEHTVEAVAIEVERVGEGQRYMTNLFTEIGAPQAIGAGEMQPLEARDRERTGQRVQV